MRQSGLVVMCMRLMALQCYTLVVVCLGHGSGDALHRGEGVGIVLDPVMTQAWHDAGESWSAVNSRVVSVCLQLNDNNILKL